MPETAMHENDLSLWIDHDIRFSRQALYTCAVPNADLFDDAAYCEFGPRTSGAHTPHYVTALFLGEIVHEQA